MSSSSSRSTSIVASIGFAAILFEGYDLIVYGNAVPALLAYPKWSLTPTRVGAIGSAALLGMFLGAPIAGWLCDLYGRRRPFIGLLAFFSLMMLLAALAPTPSLLAVCRFFAGLGFGGIPPAAIALLIEFAPTKRKVLINAVMLTGFGGGAILAGVLSVTLLDRIGFRGLFAVGALPLVSLVPLAAWLLPESPRSLEADPRPAGIRTAKLRIDLLRGRNGVALAVFAVAHFFYFMFTFALNTWMPKLMRDAGFANGVAQRSLILLAFGGIIGALVGAWVADQVGSRRAASGLFILGAVALLALSLATSASPWVLPLLFIAGAGTAQSVLLSFVALYFSHEVRATALGITSGIGRLGAANGPLIGGLLVSGGAGFGGSCAVYAAIAALAGIVTFLVPRAIADSTGFGAMSDVASPSLERAR